LGFGVVEAAEGPLAADEVVDVEALFGVGGAVVEVALLDELLEIGEVFRRKEEGFGVDAGFEVVHGRNGLASDRGGTGRFLGVTAVGFYLTKGRHGFGSGGVRGALGLAGGSACSTLRLARRSGESGGRMAASYWE
jgi:hypothetical protein